MPINCRLNAVVVRGSAAAAEGGETQRFVAVSSCSHRRGGKSCLPGHRAPALHRSVTQFPHLQIELTERGEGKEEGKLQSLNE